MSPGGKHAYQGPTVQSYRFSVRCLLCASYCSPISLLGPLFLILGRPNWIGTNELSAYALWRKVGGPNNRMLSITQAAKQHGILKSTLVSMVDCHVRWLMRTDNDLSWRERNTFDLGSPSSSMGLATQLYSRYALWRRSFFLQKAMKCWLGRRPQKVIETAS